MTLLNSNPMEHRGSNVVKSHNQTSSNKNIARFLSTMSEDRATIFLNNLLKDALAIEASDIHLEPESSTVVTRYSIDGIMNTVCIFDRSYWPRVCACVKIMSGIDLAQSNKPQSGTMHFCDVDFRVSCHPTIFGENIVIRVLSKKHNLNLDLLKFNEKSKTGMLNAIKKSSGMLIVVGPTGSGKTTTIHALLNVINNGRRNIMTLEDPVEYTIPGLRQTSVEGIGFFEGLKSILRQNPGVVFVGEIRDEDTARLAFRASMTGCLVVTTLHAKSTLHAFQRLEDLGVSKNCIIENVIGILAQRLVRKLCCGRCALCFGNEGYKGRCVISEWLEISNISDNMKNIDSVSCMTQFLQSNGMKFLLDDANRYVENRITSLEEIHRVL